LEITDLKTGEVVSTPQATFTGSLRPGPYQVRVLESGWTALRSFRFLVDPTSSPIGAENIAGLGGLRIDAASRDPSPLRDSLLDLIPGQHNSAYADFSEQIGPLANQDLGLWLSIIGASRILGAQEFSKLGSLPLVSFDDVQSGAAPIYLLAGVEGPFGVAEAAVWQLDAVAPQLAPMHPVFGIPGLHELRTDTAPGMHLVYFRAGNMATCASVAYCLPNRATLFIVATDASGDMRIHQFILPLAKLKQNLTPMEQERQPANLLEAIRFTTLAQRQMARLRSPEPPAVGDLKVDPKLEKDRESWNNLLYGKWLDPVMALMAAYELASNHKSNKETVYWLKEAVGNLRSYFSALPDVELIAKIAGFPHAEPKSLPLFLAGLQALENSDPLMPLPSAKLDYTGPWITWLGVQ
jgi:hypothetical protein